MATGDLENNIAKLRSALQSIKYPKTVDDECSSSLAQGNSATFLPIIHYVLFKYSKLVVHWIVETTRVDLAGKTETKFMQGVYKLLRNFFDYNPTLLLSQFFAAGFAERKLIMLVDLIKFVKDKHATLSKEDAADKKKFWSESQSRLFAKPKSTESLVKEEKFSKRGSLALLKSNSTGRKLKKHTDEEIQIGISKKNGKKKVVEFVNLDKEKENQPLYANITVPTVQAIKSGMFQKDLMNYKVVPQQVTSQEPVLQSHIPTEVLHPPLLEDESDVEDELLEDEDQLFEDIRNESLDLDQWEAQRKLYEHGQDEPEDQSLLQYKELEAQLEEEAMQQRMESNRLDHKQSSQFEKSNYVQSKHESHPYNPRVLISKPSDAEVQPALPVGYYANIKEHSSIPYVQRKQESSFELSTHPEQSSLKEMVSKLSRQFGEMNGKLEDRIRTMNSKLIVLEGKLRFVEQYQQELLRSRINVVNSPPPQPDQKAMKSIATETEELPPEVHFKEAISPVQKKTSPSREFTLQHSKFVNNTFLTSLPENTNTIFTPVPPPSSSLQRADDYISSIARRFKETQEFLNSSNYISQYVC